MNAMRLLLDNGAKVNQTDGEDAQTALFHTFQLPTFQLLAEHGANLDFPSRTGETPLIFHTRLSTSPAIIRYLLEKGADPKRAAARGETALHFCTAPDLIRLMVSKGADPNARDNRGRTPLMWRAVLRADGETLTTIKALLEAGAKIDLKTPEGKTASDLARDPKVKTLLQERVKADR